MVKKNKGSEIRKDYFLDRYVIITPKRGKRPRDIKEETKIDFISSCPFCPKNVENNLVKATYSPGKKWLVNVLQNKYPALTSDNPKAYGYQEVVIETPDHKKEMGDLPISHIQEIIDVYADRTNELTNDEKIEYILVFKNYGGKAGASIHHSHSQIFASELLPPDVLDELTKAHQYQTLNGICPYCQTIKDEQGGPRQVYSDKNIIAFCPYASAFHYEVWIFPRRHPDNITELSKEERKSFAKALKKIIGRLNQYNISYNYFLHQVINDPDQHFFLKIQPRESIWAGVELGSGLVINSVPPEQAAKFYNQQD